MPFPEDEFIYDDLKSSEYLKMMKDGSCGTEICRLLYDPTNEQDAKPEQCVSAVNDGGQLISEEAALNIDIP